jgi:hypothetical protein
MAGGPFFPSSIAFDTTGRSFPNVHIGDGANAHQTDGIGVEASLGGETEVDLEFDMPPGSLPSGTCKLNCIALADATSGIAVLVPSWASVAVEEDPSAATLTSEGTTTLEWGANDDDEYKQTKITLDADTPVAGEKIVMHLKFDNNDGGGNTWTLAVVSTWQFSVIFE